MSAAMIAAPEVLDVRMCNGKCRRLEADHRARAHRVWWSEGGFSPGMDASDAGARRRGLDVPCSGEIIA